MAYKFYKPYHSLWITGPYYYNLTDDLLRAKVDGGITQKVPDAEFTLDNRRDRWTDNIPWGATLYFYLSGLYEGYYRVEQINDGVDKLGGKIITLKGRGMAGALVDVVSSLEVRDRKPRYILIDIINEYNARRLWGDPYIGISENEAPDSNPMSFRWKRKSILDMMIDLSTACGAPSALGGVNRFYDFWLDIANYLHFVQAGSKSSGQTIPYGTRATKRSYVTDSYPIKNDIWLFGATAAGALPLEMQLGYNPGSGDTRTDPWTDYNAEDFGKGTNIAYISSVTSPKKFGYYSIAAVSIAPSTNGYFYIPIPFGPSGNRKIPRMYPSGGFNTYNECLLQESWYGTYSSMRETMGEINGIAFFFRCAFQVAGGTRNCKFLIEVKDGTGNLVRSPEQVFKSGWPWVEDWLFVELPFGPSSGYELVETSPDKYFDWANVSEIRFKVYDVGYHLIDPFVIYIDGLTLYKPLVVNASDSSSGKRKTLISQRSEVTNYIAAKIYAYGLLEQLTSPQVYYDFESVPTYNLYPGYTINFEGKTLLMREVNHDYSKDIGWLISARAYARNPANKWLIQEQKRLGEQLAELYRYIDSLQSTTQGSGAMARH